MEQFWGEPCPSRMFAIWPFDAVEPKVAASQGSFFPFGTNFKWQSFEKLFLLNFQLEKVILFHSSSINPEGGKTCATWGGRKCCIYHCQQGHVDVFGNSWGCFYLFFGTFGFHHTTQDTLAWPWSIFSFLGEEKSISLTRGTFNLLLIVSYFDTCNLGTFCHLFTWQEKIN